MRKIDQTSSLDRRILVWIPFKRIDVEVEPGAAKEENQFNWCLLWFVKIILSLQT